MTPKQAAFVQHYLEHMNATQAYKQAGYSVTSDAIAGVEGFKLLKNPKITAAIQTAQQARAQRLELSVDAVVANLASIAGANILDYLDLQHGGLQLKDLTQLTPDKLAAIESIKQGRNGVELKLYNKLTASDMLLKHLGGYVTSSDLIDKLPPERLEQLVNELLAKLQK
jgi:phage terminase small subunit